MAEKVLKMIENKGKSGQLSKQGFKGKPFQEIVDDGVNSRYLRIARVSLDLPKIDISDPNQVKNRIFEYLDHCEANDTKPNIVGMANWLGVSRDTLNSWKRGEYRSETHSAIIQKVVNMMEELTNMYMLDNKILPANAIFILKNHYGYQDSLQLSVEPKQPLDAGLTAAEVAEKYADALPEFSSGEY